jgi:hypothetical protein
MARAKLVQRYLAGVAAVIAAAAMTGCEGGVAMTDAPSRSLKAELRQSPRSVASRNDRAADADRDDRASEAERAAKRDESDRSPDGATSNKDQAAPILERRRDGGEDERLAMDIGDADPHLYTIVHTEGIDLEFTEGLSEPPQTQVMPSPTPWAPPPSTAEAPQPVVEDVWPDKAAAAGGAQVVIRGKNLQPAQILFGLAPARIISESAEKVVVAAPPSNAGEVGIVVTNRDGNYAVAGGAFKYYN